MAMERHFLQQLSIYGRQYCVNLVEQEGREAVVGKEYERQLEVLSNPDVWYVPVRFEDRVGPFANPAVVV
jgi:hypothetical protein